MIPTAVSPIASPIGIRRRKGCVITWRTGELGCSSSVTNRQAENMKSPRPVASMRYSGQCWRIAAGAPRPRLVTALLEELGDQSGPAGLMARAETGAVVAVEIFVERDEVPPLRVGLELGDAAVDRPAAIRPAEEDARQPSREIRRDVPQGRTRTRSGRVLDLKVGTVEVVELLKGLDQQVIDRKPDRAPPVGVSTEQIGARLGRFVVHAMLLAVHDDDAGVVTVDLRHGADPMRRKKLELVEHEPQDPGQLLAAHD